MRVIVSSSDIAPPSDRWLATAGSDPACPVRTLAHRHDMGVPVGRGPTPLAAIGDLLWHLDIENIEPTHCDIVWSD